MCLCLKPKTYQRGIIRVKLMPKYWSLCFKKLHLFNIDYMKHNCQEINKSDLFEINYQKIKNNFGKNIFYHFY